MKRTDALAVISGKLSPLIFIFGAYLICYGHRSPGGGFQGGVTLASGLILLALGRGTDTTTTWITTTTLARIEAIAFAVFLLIGLVGIIGGQSFLDLFPDNARVGFIIALNVLIGVKVGASISLLCLSLIKDADV